MGFFPADSAGGGDARKMFGEASREQYEPCLMVLSTHGPMVTWLSLLMPFGIYIFFLHQLQPIHQDKMPISKALQCFQRGAGEGKWVNSAPKWIFNLITSVVD